MLLIDAHVHIYDCYDLERLFQSAYTNFLHYSREIANYEEFTGVLFLTEGENQNFFSLLSHPQNNLKLANWQVTVVNDKRLLKVEDRAGHHLYLCKGCQHISDEGIEVLELLKTNSSVYHLPAREIIKKIKEEQGIPVLPWAFGKWFGKRGKVIHNLYTKKDLHPVYFGDNGGRTKVIHSGYLKEYKNKRGALLSGSDPLPIKGEEDRVGSFGIYSKTEVDTDNLCEELTELFNRFPHQFKGFGHHTSLMRFVKNQFLLRFEKCK